MPSPTTASPARRYDLDWLRVLAILVVFIFHSGRFFDEGGWHVKNAVTYEVVQIWTTFLANWMMPLIFVISGASTFYALGKRGAGRFVKDRALRLLVPLVVGIFTHVAVQVYLERLSHHQFRGSFWEFLPRYFDGWYGFGGNFAWMGLHLWYLEILFVLSLLCLPLFLWLRHAASGQRVLRWLGDALAFPGAIYLLALPIILLLNWLDPSSTLGSRDFGGWSLLIYLLFLLYGFLLASSDRLQQSVERVRWVSLIAGLAAVAALIYLWAGMGGDPMFGTRRFAQIISLFGLSAWCWNLAFWGFSRKHLNFHRPVLDYANEAVLPFYILHQSVLIYLGYFVVRWDIADPLKWLVIAPTAFAICLVLYEFAIRRISVLRFLFGMKVAPRPAARPLTAAPAPRT